MSRDRVEDLRFPGEAYRFLLDALERTRIRYQREGHVSGQELLEGIREHASDLYGPTSAMVFESWGVRDGSDFGFMVFELVERGVLARREEDAPTDFEAKASYRQLFEEEYFNLPEEDENEKEN
ncbi:hypothetical protein H8E52_06350 [bacterium]|nr:hypothetical protein [bacterium]